MSTPAVLLPKVRSDLLMSSVSQMPCALRVGTFLGLRAQSSEVPAEGRDVDGTL